METTYDDEHRKMYLSGGQVINGSHRSTECLGDVCPVHKPSEHKYSKYPLIFNGMSGSFYRDVDGKLVLDPDDYLLNKYGSVIISNSVVCNECGDVLVSAHQHDFVTCACGETSVDGGASYLRRLGSNYTEISEVVYKE